MIKKFKQYNENILSVLKGPTENEILDNLKNLEPNKLLLKSVNIGFLKGVKNALKEGADINCSDKASFYGGQGAGTTGYDYFGVVYPLSLAIKNKNIEIAEFLLVNNADINIDNGVCLRRSSFKGDIDMVRFLLEHGANPKEHDKDGESAMSNAVNNGFVEIVHLLIKYGVSNINESTEFNLDIDITDLNQELIDKLIDKLSFVYKKLKDRHVRPINIKGKTSTDNIDLKIILSNKDKIDFSFKKENEIKISINGNLLFHMDDFNKDNILNKLYKIYTDYLKEGKYKITKKDNPFESLDLSILENFSNTNPNPGILNRDGRNFWYGVYDIETGYIQDVYEYNETAYMNNDYYISDECLDLINSYQSDIFWINSSGDIESEWNLYLDEEDEETEKIQFLISKIKEQISFVGSFKEIYNRNKKLVYENKNNKNYEKRYNN